LSRDRICSPSSSCGVSASSTATAKCFCATRANIFSASSIAVTSKLAPYLPAPIVVEKDGRYRLDYDRPKSIGRVRSFFGNTGVLVRMYCYLRTHGPDGLRRIAENAVLNANYLQARLKEENISLKQEIRGQ